MACWQSVRSVSADNAARIAFVRVPQQLLDLFLGYQDPGGIVFALAQCLKAKRGEQLARKPHSLRRLCLLEHRPELVVCQKWSDPEKLFRPFTQGGENKSGLGLGLSIVRRSVEANNAILRVRDRPGIGCVFTIDLPRHSMESASPQAETGQIEPFQRPAHTQRQG